MQSRTSDVRIGSKSHDLFGVGLMILRIILSSIPVIYGRVVPLPLPFEFVFASL